MRSLAVAGLVASLLVPSVAHAGDGDRWDLPTIGVQYGGAISGGAIGGVAGGLLGLSIGYGAARRGDWGPPLVGGTLGMFAGAFAGAVIGVQYTGDQRDGTGRWWGTLGGAAVGTGGGLALVLATDSARGLFAYKAAGFILIAITATVAGYHLSAEASASDSRRVMATPLTLQF